jgi:hypothetical protein
MPLLASAAPSAVKVERSRRRDARDDELVVVVADDDDLAVGLEHGVGHAVADRDQRHAIAPAEGRIGRAICVESRERRADVGRGADAGDGDDFAAA